MDVPVGRALERSADTLLESVAALLPAWQARAAALDASGGFPSVEIDQLREVGGLVAPVPRGLGGLGLGTEPHGGSSLLDLLRLIGRGNLSVGRLFEGHVNALKLIAAYGTTTQQRRAADDAAAGHLFAIWNTDAEDGVRLHGDVPRATLQGSKIFCSGAGYATRAVVTAAYADAGQQMLIVRLAKGERVVPSAPDLHGMRASVTGMMTLDGIVMTESAILGKPGDYLRQPAFSAGAWRSSAVALGGLETLVDETCYQLEARLRHGSPLQQSRVGEALIARETALLWLRKAADLAETADQSSEDVVGYVNLTRIAVEAACLDAIRLVQRSLGLAAMIRPNPVERLLRDLTTYLRQPAPDEALTSAAAWFMRRALPGSCGGVT